MSLASLTGYFILKERYQHDNISQLLTFPIAPMSAVSINLNQPPYNISTFWNEYITVSLSGTSQDSGVIDVGIHSGDIKCSYYELKLDDRLSRKHLNLLVRYWTSSTNASGIITCEDDSSNILVNFTNIYPLAHVYNTMNYPCTNGVVDVADIYSHIMAVHNNSQDVLVHVTMMFQNRIMADQIILNECLPIPHDTTDNYKAIQLNDDHDNLPATLELGSVFSELTPSTQSRLLINTRGMNYIDVDDNYSEIFVDLKLSGSGRQIIWIVASSLMGLSLILAVGTISLSCFIYKCR
jgi:hypothetical protein